MIELIYKGYDQSSDSLRYGFHPKYNDNRIFRINRSEKVTLYVTMACLCTLGFAYSKVKKQETEHLSSWVA